MFQKIDCIRIEVPDLERAIEYYTQVMGLRLNWKRGTSDAGLKMIDSETELVLVTEKLDGSETDILVKSADAAAEKFRLSGGSIVVEPFDIPIGRCAVLEDPWKNRFVVLDMTKGKLHVDDDGNVLE